MSFAVRRLVPAGVRAFHSTAARKDFGWSKLVTPLTSPAFISRMKELDAKFASMKSEMFGVSDTVAPIDWEALEKGISNKALFAQIRKEYESITFPKIEGEDLTQINAALDASIERASAAAEISRAELPKLRAQLAEAQAEKHAVHNWTMDDYFRRYPGLEEQLREEYMRADYLPSDAEERMEQLDVQEALKALRTGAPFELPEGLPNRVGDLNFDEERKKIDAMLDKMFGGAKAYEELKAAERAAEAKKATAVAEH